MTNFNLHPALPLFMAAFIIPFLRNAWCRVALLLAPVLSLLMLIALPANTSTAIDLLGFTLIPIRADKLALIFCFIFILVSFLGNLYALHVKEKGEHAVSLLYAASSVAAVLAGDLLTFFLFLEVMAVSATLLIWHRKTNLSIRAGFRYILFHMAGGSCIFAGVLIQYLKKDSLVFGHLGADLSGWLILIGIAVNAAIPPLHAWLTDAYPQSTVSGGVYLSAFTTKVAVYALARGYSGVETLAWLGAFMAVYGVVFAMLQNDIRKLLSYHIISQVGYMVCGIGMGTAMGVSGASAHAFCHILYKGLLFMATGAILHVTGESKMTELGKLGMKMPLIILFYMVGAFSISGVPLFNGFVSKSIVVSAAEHSHQLWLEMMLVTASAGTFLSISLKLPFFTFVKNVVSVKKPVALPSNMLLAMVSTAILCLFIGLYPSALYNLLPYNINYEPYTLSHVLQTLEVITATALGFVLFAGKLKPKETLALDVDYIYRKLIPFAWQYANFVLSPANYYICRYIRHIGYLANSIKIRLNNIYSIQGRFAAGVHLLIIVIILLTAVILAYSS